MTQNARVPGSSAQAGVIAGSRGTGVIDNPRRLFGHRRRDLPNATISPGYAVLSRPWREVACYEIDPEDLSDRELGALAAIWTDTRAFDECVWWSIPTGLFPIGRQVETGLIVTR